MNHWEAGLHPHPPYCTCADCVARRLQKQKDQERHQSNPNLKIPYARRQENKGVESDGLVHTSNSSEIPPGEGPPKKPKGIPPPPKSQSTTPKPPTKIPKWVFALLLIFSLSLMGLGLSAYTGSSIPLWLLLGFSTIFSIEKWFTYFTRKSKALGKLYRLVLNLSILSTLGLLVWSSIQLFSKQFIHSPLVGSLVLLAEFVFFIWMWKQVAKNSWRWPSMKLTVFLLICIALVFTFAGVPPLSTYKDNLVTKWEEHQAEQAVEKAEREAAEVIRWLEEEEARVKAEQEAKEAARIEEEEEEEVVTGWEVVPPEEGGIQSSTPTEVSPPTGLRNPSWAELKAFLLIDDTDTIEYIYPTTVCWDFANKLQRNAEVAGWRCAVVNLEMTGYPDPYNYGIAHDAGHACNAFETTDRGLVYIDCTGPVRSIGPWPSNNDRVVNVQIGQQYNPQYLFPSGGWYVPSGQLGIVVGIDIQW